MFLSIDCITQKYFFSLFFFRWIWFVYHRVVRQRHARPLHRWNRRGSDGLGIPWNNPDPLVFSPWRRRSGSGIISRVCYCGNKSWSLSSLNGIPLCLIWKELFNLYIRFTQRVFATFARTSVSMNGRHPAKRRSYDAPSTDDKLLSHSPEESSSTSRWTR